MLSVKSSSPPYPALSSLTFMVPSSSCLCILPYTCLAYIFRLGLEDKRKIQSICNPIYMIPYAQSIFKFSLSVGPIFTTSHSHHDLSNQTMLIVISIISYQN